ncbi:hypothetical protein ACSBR2_019886 [Camellia fascicularis]
MLGSPVSDKEIKDVVWSLKANKAPGPDGFTACFFKASWDIVGKEVTQAIRSFFQSGKLLSEVNSTIIALIPKAPNPVKVGDFRPISCCNTIYKCIAKIIANRIKVVLPDLIDPVQSAFVHGRRISDNIFLSQEIMRGYHRQSSTPKCAMKVDIMKAYDTVRWDFIIDVLKAMAFPPTMISWIQSCITSPSFSICVNGSLHGYFKGARGLRQGDPMSPYLFVLAMEILARILAEKSKHPLFKFHWRCKKTKIVNLCFADDLMIFSKGDIPTVQMIMQGLEEFTYLSGLTPSMSKSNIFFCGCNRDLRNEILQVVNFAEGSLPVKYLGVPLITTKLRATDCHQLIDRITNRIKSWTNKALSYAGRAQLIQTILFSMQVYWSSLFILPKKVIRDIENLLRAFLWSGVALKKHSAKVAWDQVCAPKREGGLGFKSLEVWNRAAIAKHIWFLFSGGEMSMWCQWVKSYLLKGRSFWKVSIPNDPSWVWRKILSLRKAIFPLILHKIGKGNATFLWYDNWHPVGSLWNKFGARIMYDSGLQGEAKVSDIVSGDSWKWPFPNSWEIRELISLTPRSFKPASSTNDTLFWTLNPDGNFSIQSAWSHWRVKKDEVAWHKLLRGPCFIPRVSFIVWFALHGKLHTRDRLKSFGMIDDDKCSFCQDHTENHSHLFFNCIFSHKVWNAIKVKCNVNWPDIFWLDIVPIVVEESKKKTLKSVITRLALLSTIYHIWVERNKRIFTKEMKPEEIVIKSIVQMVRGRLMSVQNFPRSAGDAWFLQQWNLNDSILKPNASSFGRAAE